MRYKKLLITAIVIGFSIISSQAQNLSTNSDEELETMKEKAISNENFELAKQIKDEQNARKSLEDKLKEKQEELKTALANENYEKAEQLKSEIAQLEADIAKLKELEEDKKIAIFQERYNDVIALEQEIRSIKTGTYKPSVDTQPPSTIESTTSTTHNESALITTLNNKSISKTSLNKVDLDEVGYNDKVIAHFGFGIGGYSYEDKYYDSYYNSYYTDYYDESVFSLTFNISRWWINKYLAGGYFIDFSPSEYGGFSYGAQMTGLAEFEAIVLPYASFGMGPGYNAWDEEFYFPIIFKVGSYVFFNQKRGIGAFVEFNKHLNNEYMPKYRVGIAWSYVKRRARK